MDKIQILLKLDELLELDPGTLTGNEQLADLEGWDSLAVIGLIALADESFNKALSLSGVTEAKKINDLIALLV